jgi:GTP-binding protein Era
VAREAFTDADLVLYLIDGTRAPGPEEDNLAEALKGASDRLVCAINKSDSRDSAPDAARAFLAERFPAAPVLGISALNGEGLDALLELLYARAPEGPAWYPEEYYTDQEPVFRIAEIIRERIIAHTREEVPHAVYVAYRESRKLEDGSLEVECDIVAERESQKGILVGKGGAMIRTIRIESESELSRIFGYPVLLRLRVVIDPDWRKDDKRLKDLIF